MTGRRPTNWAGNITFAARRFLQPSRIDELQRIVATSDHVRALGTGHSFNRIADCTGDLVSVAGLPPTVDIDAERATVTVAAGVRYGELTGRLHAAGYALRNLGSLPHISVAGACSTGTHGSGMRNGNLATAVAALELVGADGELRRVARGDDEFGGSVIALGALGIVTHLTLDLVPAYEVRQYVYDDLPYDALRESFAEIASQAYSVSLFPDWRGARRDTPIKQVWLKRRTDEQDGWIPEPRWHGARLADGPRHPVPGMPAENCTEQGGLAGPWHERLPHFRLAFTPSSGEELQSEYLLPREHAVDALDAIGEVRGLVAPALQVAEVRTVAADELWMSPSYRSDTVAFHFTWVKDVPAVTAAVGALEERLAPFGARPHWGKVFTTSPEVVSGLYERLPDFRRLLRDRDPGGKFRNELVDRYVPPE